MAPLPSLAGTGTKYRGRTKGRGRLGIIGTGMEPASGIEPPTCGLRNLDNPTSGNLTPPETTQQDTHKVGADGAGLSCPGSSEVAEAPTPKAEPC